MTDQRARAEQLIEQMGNYPGVSEHFRGEWLAYYKQDIEILATALADAERRGLTKAYHAAARKYAEWINGHESLEIPRFEDWLEAQAQADQEAPHGTDAE